MNSPQEIREALVAGKFVDAKPRRDSHLYSGDWLRIDDVLDDGALRVADHLSGFNTGAVGQYFYAREIEISD